MEEVLQTLGVIGLILLIGVGVLAGLLASLLEGGRNRPRNVAIGVAGALALPFLVALVAAGALVAGGLLLILIAAALGALAVLLLVRLLSR